LLIASEIVSATFSLFGKGSELVISGLLGGSGTFGWGGLLLLKG
jgi:hypothetical protein